MNPTKENDTAAGIVDMKTSRKERKHQARLRLLIIRMSGHNTIFNSLRPIHCFWFIIETTTKKTATKCDRVLETSLCRSRGKREKKYSWIGKKGYEKLCRHYFFEYDCSALFTLPLSVWVCECLFLSAHFFLWYFICLEIHFFCFFFLLPSIFAIVVCSIRKPFTTKPNICTECVGEQKTFLFRKLQEAHRKRKYEHGKTKTKQIVCTPRFRLKTTTRKNM